MQEEEKHILGASAMMHIMEKINQVEQNSKALEVVKLIQQLNEKSLFSLNTVRHKFIYNGFSSKTASVRSLFEAGLNGVKRLDERFI